MLCIMSIYVCIAQETNKRHFFFFVFQPTKTSKHFVVTFPLIKFLLFFCFSFCFEVKIGINRKFKEVMENGNKELNRRIERKQRKKLK